MVKNNGQMELIIKESLLKALDKEKENISSQKINTMKVIGIMILCMVKAHIFGKTEENIKDNG